MLNPFHDDFWGLASESQPESDNASSPPPCDDDVEVQPPQRGSTLKADAVVFNPSTLNMRTNRHNSDANTLALHDAMAMMSELVDSLTASVSSLRTEVGGLRNELADVRRQLPRSTAVSALNDSSLPRSSSDLVYVNSTSNVSRLVPTSNEPAPRPRIPTAPRPEARYVIEPPAAPRWKVSTPTNNPNFFASLPPKSGPTAQEADFILSRELPEFTKAKVNLSSLMRDFTDNRVYFVATDNSVVCMAEYQIISKFIKSGEDPALYLKGEHQEFRTGYVKRTQSFTINRLFFPTHYAVVPRVGAV